MKKILLYLIILFIGASFSACGDDETKPNGYIEQTAAGSSTFVLKGYLSAQQGYNVLKPAEMEHSCYIKNQQLAGDRYMFCMTNDKRLDTMADAPNWDSELWKEELPIVSGKTYWAMCRNTAEYRYVKMRIAYIDGNLVGVEYAVSARKDAIWNASTSDNMNANDASKGEAALLLEIPRLNPLNYFAPHYVDYNGQHIMNLAVEWDKTVRHSTWVAFSWDATTSQDNVARGSSWKWDPLIPSQEWNGVTEDNHKSDGYDKGHLCASEDRVYCKEANDQTFYYSNISPQIAAFNQQYWAGLEDMTRSWGRSTQTKKYDKVYVVKGATVSERLLNFTGKVKANDNLFPTADANGLSKGGMAVPAYYYMAFLAVKDGKYQAIAFLVPHTESLNKKPASNSEYQTYAVSINTLEEKTGIDFFCNLPDKTEEYVERAFAVSEWDWKN